MFIASCPLAFLFRLSAFVSFRFSGASNHFMASSYGGPRVYVEAPALRDAFAYKPNQMDPDQRDLIDGFNTYMMNRFPVTTDPNGAGRMHLGLQNDGYTATDVQARSPTGYAQLKALDKKYDPSDVTKSDFEDRILGKGQWANGGSPPAGKNVFSGKDYGCPICSCAAPRTYPMTFFSGCMPSCGAKCGSQCCCTPSAVQLRSCPAEPK